jgi:hypothetical protein
MTARDHTGESPQESSGDSTTSDDPAPYNEDVATAAFGTVAGTFGTIERPEVVGAPAVDVHATHYADGEDQSVVSVGYDLDGHRVTLTLSPRQARGLAADLEEAAAFAERGDPEGER